MYFTKPLILLTSLAGVLSSPITSGGPGGKCGPGTPPTLPVNGGDKELAAPPSNLKLKHIALGLGIQNYTCASVGATPVATGALAMLYDLTPFYPHSSRQAFSQSQFDSLPALALDTHDIPLNFDPSLPNRIPAAHQGASATNPFGSQRPLRLQGIRQSFPFIGQHYFDNSTPAGVPNFVLDNGAIHTHSKKLDAIPAPASADAGPDGTGAVAWLQLGDNGGSIGATYVYRVLTAGGNSHGCSSGVGGDSTTYATYYWFYG